MPLYEIPCWKRSASLDPQNMQSKVACLHIDAVGLFVYYNKKEQLDPVYIRRHLIMRSSVECVVEARNVKMAIQKFFAEYEGALIGGERESEKALWINKDKPILGLPFCDLMRKNQEKQFICGEEIEDGEDGNGEYGMCVLERYDAPDKCPIDEFYGNIKKISPITISGYKVILSSVDDMLIILKERVQNNLSQDDMIELCFSIMEKSDSVIEQSRAAGILSGVIKKGLGKRTVEFLTVNSALPDRVKIILNSSILRMEGL